MKKKILIIIGIIVLLGIINSKTDKTTEKATQSPSPVITTPSVASSKPEDQIKALIQKKLEGNNNMGWPYEEEIKITKDSTGKFEVIVKFNADDNLSKGLIKTGVQMKVSEIITVLFTERQDIQNVAVFALFPLQDKYGNAFRGDVYIAKMDVNEAKKVNWSLDSSTLALTILPKIYNVSYPHKIF